MDVDYWGVVNGTKVFLPHLIASGDGHVVNVSSLFGIFSVPGQAAYNSAKFAVRGFTEALRQEMAAAGHPVKVTTVHPGGIKTAIMRNSTAAEGVDKDGLTKIFDKRLTITTPEKAAQIILDAVRKNRARVLVGPDAKVLDLIVRAHGIGLSAAVLDGPVADRAERALIHCDTCRDGKLRRDFRGKNRRRHRRRVGHRAGARVELARRGAKLAISDVDTEGLAHTEERSGGHRRTSEGRPTRRHRA